MPKKLKIVVTIFLAAVIVANISSCKKLDALNHDPDLGPMTQGFKASAAVGFCASLAATAFTGGDLPPNVTFNKTTIHGYTRSGTLHVHITPDSPLPFNSSIGDIYIAGLWDGINGGVISILFGDFDVVHADFKFYGIYTVPISKKASSGTINTVFAEEDIIVGEGSDTLINLSLTKPQFNSELLRLNNGPPAADVYALVKQNLWFISIEQSVTPSDIYDDVFTVNGGGQIAKASNTSGGILYHALIQTEFCYTACKLNPTSGTGFIQNLQAVGSSVDLGNITLNFHDPCDGKANVTLALGKYVGYNGQNVNLNWK